jgi:hypothetical protein
MASSRERVLSGRLGVGGVIVPALIYQSALIAYWRKSQFSLLFSVCCTSLPGSSNASFGCACSMVDPVFSDVRRRSWREQRRIQTSTDREHDCETQIDDEADARVRPSRQT